MTEGLPSVPPVILLSTPRGPIVPMLITTGQGSDTQTGIHVSLMVLGGITWERLNV